MYTCTCGEGRGGNEDGDDALSVPPLDELLLLLPQLRVMVRDTRPSLVNHITYHINHYNI